MNKTQTPVELGFRPYCSTTNSWYHPEFKIRIKLYIGRETGSVWFQAYWHSVSKTHRDPCPYDTWHKAYQAVSKQAERYWRNQNKKKVDN